MQTQTNDTDHTHLVETLSTMILQINALQAILCSEVAGIGEAQRNVVARGDADVGIGSCEEAQVQASSSHYTHALLDGLTILEQMAQAALHQARSIDEDILPAQLIGVTLSEALSHAVEETAEKLGLSSRIAFSGNERTLPSYTESLLYRVAQETLYQLEHYIGARKLRFMLNYGHDEVQMNIEHDGVPTTKSDDLPAPILRTGVIYHAPVMSDLKHRIEHLGGVFQVNSGTEGEQFASVQVRIPYEYHEKIDDSKIETRTASYPENVVAQSSPDSLSLADTRETDALSTGVMNHAPKVSVLVVEAQAVTRAGLRRLLESYPDLQVIGEATDGLQAVSETLELGPQVVLMDMHLSNGQSLEAVRQIKQLNLNSYVLLLSALDREDYLYEALRAGAGGYILKDIAPDELAQAIRTVARGEVLVHPQLARRLLTQISRQTPGTYPSETLTAREQEVLRLLARGLRNKEMATRLHVSERTINFHLANIYQKLNVSGRTEALSKALEQGLITAG